MRTRGTAGGIVRDGSAKSMPQNRQTSLRYEGGPVNKTMKLEVLQNRIRSQMRYRSEPGDSEMPPTAKATDGSRVRTT